MLMTAMLMFSNKTDTYTITLEFWLENSSTQAHQYIG